MSRVHDALKKAEEEKAIRGDTDSVVETKTPPAPALHPLEKTRVPANPRPAAKPESRTRQDELLPESFVENCPRQHWNWDRALTQSVDSRRHTIVSEEFRTLRSQLYLMRKVRQLHKLLVTSPLPGEGKTFVAANLARVIAKQADSRVLLIDSDMRLPSMHTVLGAPSEPGLGEYLGGKHELNRSSSEVSRRTSSSFPGGEYRRIPRNFSPMADLSF